MMRHRKPSSGTLRPLSGFRSGAVAGAGSALIFTWIHDQLISDIWFSLPAMLVAGAVCGGCLGGSFYLVSDRFSARAWIRFNLFFLSLFVALAAMSVLIYSPVTTVAALLSANEPPTELIRQAVPLIIGFVICSALLLGRIYARDGKGIAALLVTTIVLMLFLGLNVAVIGLVSVNAGGFFLIVEMFALIAMLCAAFAAMFLTIERAALNLRPRRETHVPERAP